MIMTRHMFMGVLSLLISTAPVLAQTPPDDWEEDDYYYQSGWINANVSGAHHHNFHDAGDADWVKIKAFKGECYTISIENVGSKADPMIEVFDSDGVTSLMPEGPKDNKGPGGEEFYDFDSIPETSVYYIRISYDVSFYNDTGYGDDTEYGLSVDQCLAPDGNCNLIGLLHDPEGDPVMGATATVYQDGAPIETCSVLEKDGGAFKFEYLSSGPYALEIDASGFESKAFDDIQLNDFQTTDMGSIEMAVLCLSGDVNGNGRVTLDDVKSAFALMVASPGVSELCAADSWPYDSQISFDDVKYVYDIFIGKYPFR